MTIEELKVIITGEVSDLKRSIKEAKNQITGVEAHTKKAVNNMSRSFTSLAKTITGSFKKLTGIFTKVLSVAGLLSFAKTAIKIGSDVEQVQNVVDVAFGKMADEAQFFATKCAAAFGLSALKAKEYSSQLMAMLNAMGFAKDLGKDMALQMTALSGDLASFYNTTNEEAFEALQSVITGTTRPMRRFGIDLTEATLQEYALSKGIATQVEAMTNAQKVALRYNYVMEATTQLHGDFARTSHTWANAIRILGNRSKEFASIIGMILIHFLTPMISVINQIIGLAIQAAKALAGIFGVNLEIANVGGAVDFGNDIADSMDNANESASKLKRTILGFDEVNRLSGQDSGEGAGSGSFGGGNIGFDLVNPYDFKEWTNETKTLKQMLDSLAAALDKYNKSFKKNKEVVQEWGRALSKQFNYFTKNFPWGKLGQSIGSTVSLVYSFIYEVLVGTDWKKLGESIRDFFVKGLKATDFTLIGKTIAAKINASFKFFKQIVADKSFWESVGNSIVNGINGFISEIDVKEAAQTLAGIINGIASVIKQLIAEINWKEATSKLAEGLKEMFSSIDPSVWFIVGLAIGGKLIEGLIAFLLGAGKSLLTSTFAQVFAADSFSNILNNLDDILDIGKVFKPGEFKITSKGIKNVITEEVTSFSSLFGQLLSPLGDAFKKVFNPGKDINHLFGDIFTKIPEHFKKASKSLKINISDSLGYWPKIFGVPEIDLDDMKLAKLSKMSPKLEKALGSVVKVIDGSVSKIGGAVSKVGGIFAPLVDKVGGVFSKIGGIFSKFGSGVAKWFGGFSITGKILLIVAAIALVAKALTDLYNKNEKFRERVNALWNDTLVPLFDTLKKFWEEHLKPIFTQLGELLSTFYNDIFVPIIGFIAELLMDLLPIFTEVIGTVIEILGPLFDVIGFFIQILKGLLEFISGVFSGDWAKAWEGIKNIFSGVWEAIVAIGKFFANGFIGIINLAIKGVESVLNFVIDGINALLSRVNKAINNVGSLLGKSWDVNLHINRVSWRGIPYLAEGGIALGPTMAMIGEKGKEAVLPLENNTGWMDALAEKLAAKTKGPSKIVLNVDGKELGYAAINNINSITKQTGSLPLKLA